jgi:hypothetical protein
MRARVQCWVGCALALAASACKGANSAPGAVAPDVVPTAQLGGGGAGAPAPSPLYGVPARGMSFRVAVVEGLVCLLYSGPGCGSDTCPALHAWAKNDLGDKEDLELTSATPPPLAHVAARGEWSGCVTNQHPAPLVRPGTKWIAIGGLSWGTTFSTSQGDGESERIVFAAPPNPADELDDAPRGTTSDDAGDETSDVVEPEKSYEGVVAVGEERVYRAGDVDVLYTVVARTLCKRGAETIVVGARKGDAGWDDASLEAVNDWPDPAPESARALEPGDALHVSNDRGPCRVQYRIKAWAKGDDLRR